MNTVQRIKELAKERGIKLSYICQRLGLNGRTYFNDVESKGITIPNERLIIIADILNTTVDYLLCSSDDKEKKPAEEADLESVKVALFGGAEEVTDEMWDEVRNFAEYVKSKHNNDKNN